MILDSNEGVTALPPSFLVVRALTFFNPAINYQLKILLRHLGRAVCIRGFLKEEPRGGRYY